MPVIVISSKKPVTAPVLTLTLDAPSADYSAYFPGTYAACNVVVTGGYVNDCILEYSDDAGVSWGLLALLADSGGGENWGGSYSFSTAGTFLLRFKAYNSGGDYFYSNEVTATITSPTATITSPASGEFISTSFTASGTIDAWTEPGITANAISRIGGVQQELVAMALTSPPGGWSAAMSFPGEGAGTVEVTFLVNGYQYSDSVPVSFVSI